MCYPTTVLQESSAVVEWSLNKATIGVDNVVRFPYVKDQLLAIDRLLCSSLDLTELSLPVLTRTPQEVLNLFRFNILFH